MRNIWIVAAALALWGCSGEGVGNGTINPDGTGVVQLTLEPGAAIVISSGAVGKSGVDVSGFGVSIATDKGQEVKNYSSYSDVPSELALEAGDYVLAAENNGVRKGAAFDRPYYAGSAPFSVRVGETTPVKVVCELQSTGVEVTYTASMLSALTDIAVTVSVEGGNLAYSPDEKRTGWFTVPADRKITVYVRGMRGGKELSSTQTVSNVAPKELRRIALDIKTSGSSAAEITIDPTIVRKDVTVSIPDSDDVIDNNGDTGSWEEGGDEPTPTGGPTVVGKSLDGRPFDIDKTQTIDPDAIQVLDVAMTSTDAAGLQNLWLEIDSELLTPVVESTFGIDGPIDLANPEAGAAWVDAFKDLGLIDPANPIKGKTEHLFSVGGFMSLLGLVDTEGGVPHRFKIKAVDAKGATEKTLTIVLFR